jgi:hypothetical protein
VKTALAPYALALTPQERQAMLKADAGTETD